MEKEPKINITSPEENKKNEEDKENNDYRYVGQVGVFFKPPGSEIEYAVGALQGDDEDYIIVKKPGSRIMEVYCFPDESECSHPDFNPWESTPSLGRYLGTIENEFSTIKIKE